MQFTKNIEKNFVIVFGKKICAALALFIFTITLIQIIFRVFFGIALAWVFELVSICAVYLSFIGASVVVLGEKATKFFLVFEMFPSNIKRIVTIFMKAMYILMGIAILYSAIIYREILGLYKMSNIPISSSLLAYPIILLGVCLIWKALEKGKRWDK